MELKVGMYVITKDRIKIGKIKDFCYCEMCKRRGFYEPIIDNDIYITNYDKDNNFADYEFYENIIDLIEVGDYVNGYEVIGFDATYFNGVDRREEPKRLSAIVDRDKFMGFAQTHFKNEDIKTILTKEVFKANKYRVETD